jgi:opacity protein-like surface antigen
MKLKISEIDKSYLVNKEVIVDNGTPFHFPYEDEKSMQYARTDFGARFGIGYAVGVSYNFNPNIYLDLRLNKVMWDNTTTNSQRAVSNGVTKVPFTQLSLGYKFKNK